MMSKSKVSSLHIFVYCGGLETQIIGCVESVLVNTPKTCSVLFITDGVSRALVTELTKMCKPVRSKVGGSIGLINNCVPLGLARSLNKAVAITNSEYICVITPEVRVTSYWIEGLYKCILSEASLGVTAPLTSGGIRQNICTDISIENYAIEAVADLIKKTSRHFYPRVTSVSVCPLISRNALLRVGDFPQGATPVVEFCHKARQAGFGIAIADNVFVKYTGPDTPLIKDDKEFFEKDPLCSLRKDLKRDVQILVNRKIPIKSKTREDSEHDRCETLSRRNPAESSLARETTKSETKRILIVIPVYNQLEYLRECVKSIEERTVGEYNILFVNDGSDSDTTQWINEQTGTLGRYAIRHEDPMGFTAACNECIQFTQYEYYVFVNSDCRIETFDWLNKMREALEKANAVACGPISNNAQKQSLNLQNCFLDDITERRYPKWILVHGFCFMIQADIFQEYKFNAIEFPHFGSEDDLFLRLYRDEKNCCIADHVYIYHHKGRSYSTERRHKLVKPATLLLKQKYGALFDRALSHNCTRALEYLKQKVDAENSLYDIIIEVPAIAPGPPGRLCSSGGVMRMVDTGIELKRMGYKVHLRIQKKIAGVSYGDLELELPFSVGQPDKSIPSSKCIITYSDNPYQAELSKLSQVKHKFALMLSYGMCKQQESKVVSNVSIVKLCSTLNIQKLISLDGGKCTWVGFAFDTNLWYPDPNVLRERRTVAIMYHKGVEKRYNKGWEVCNKLLKHGGADKVLVFGSWSGKGPYIEDSRVEYFANASVDTLRQIYSRASLFISPSTAEGLNRTPIEATLCGCPAVLMAGALEEIFFDHQNCYVVPPFDYDTMYKIAVRCFKCNQGQEFREHMLKILSEQYTWDKHLPRLISALGV